MKTNGTVAADLAKGAAAGAAATWVMDRVDWFMVEHEDPEAWRQTQRVRPNGKDPAHNMVGAMAKAVGREPPPQPHPAGIAMHYALAMSTTALYGATRRHIPGGMIGRSLVLGLGMFAIEDELINPMLGFAAPPRRYPWQAHARGLVAHLVLGLVTEAVLSAFDSPRREPRARSDRRAREATQRRDEVQASVHEPQEPEIDMYGVRFPLEENGSPITVVVPYETLHKVEGIYSGGPVDQNYVDSFKRHQWALEAAARHELREGRVEADGTVRIGTDSLTVLDRSR
jgi:hypothetical protein